MNFRSLLSFALLMVCAASTAHAIAVPTFEGFDTNAADWRGTTTATAVTWNPSGGPNGSAYISTDLAITSSQPVLFRAHVNAADPNGPVNSSNGTFAGDWLSAGADKVQMFVRHDASEALTFILRLAPIANTPGVQVVTAAPVPASTSWVPLEFDLTYSNPLLSVGAAPPLEPKYLTTMGSVTNFQVAVSRPGGFADTTTFTFDLDSVLVVPEPASVMLMVTSLVGCFVGLRIRRQQA